MALVYLESPLIVGENEYIADCRHVFCPPLGREAGKEKTKRNGWGNMTSTLLADNLASASGLHRAGLDNSPESSEPDSHRAGTTHPGPRSRLAQG